MGELELLGREVERVCGHLPEVDVRGWAHECPLKAVLQLLSAPERDEACWIAGQAGTCFAN